MPSRIEWPRSDLHDAQPIQYPSLFPDLTAVDFAASSMAPDVTIDLDI